MALAPLEEMLEIERGTDVPNDELPNVSSLLRRRLLRGDALNATEVAHDYKVSNGLLAQVTSQMSGIGFEVTSEVDEGRRFLRLADPDQPFSLAKIQAYRVRRDMRDSRAKEASKKSKASKATTKASNATAEVVDVAPPPRTVDKAPPPPLPAFGADLRVYLIAEEPDGAIVLGLANGTAKWLTTVTGYTKT